MSGLVRSMVRESFPVPVPPVKVQLSGSSIASATSGFGVALTVTTPVSAAGTTNVLVSGSSSPSSISSPMFGSRLSTSMTFRMIAAFEVPQLALTVEAPALSVRALTEVCPEAELPSGLDVDQDGVPDGQESGGYEAAVMVIVLPASPMAT